MNLRTLNDVLFSMAERDLPNAMCYRTGGVWHQISGKRVYQQVTDVAQFLRAQGLKKATA